MFYKIYRTEAGRVQEDLFMNKESYLFDRIRWGAAIFLIFHISLLFILFLQDWKTEKMKWFILFLGVLYVILIYAAYQLIYRPLKVNSRIKAAFARGDSYEDIYHMPYLLNEEEQNMLRRFYALLDKSELITVSKKKSEYLALQNQINPHFLYNTLDSIVWMAEGGNNRQVVEMTTDLSDFFRTVLSGGKDFITVEEEESHIRSYLKIQKIRYEDILDYSIQIEPGIKDHIVLKMLLQPLVENALYHGIKNKRGGGCIIIRGYEDRDNLIFEVEDNGSGMDPETLEKVRKKLSGTFEGEQADLKKGGFGLNNVAQRLRMYYGDQAEILVESEKGIGTCFKIFLNKKT